MWYWAMWEGTRQGVVRRAAVDEDTILARLLALNAERAGA
jgi:hypothetical protein